MRHQMNRVYRSFLVLLTALILWGGMVFSARGEELWNSGVKHIGDFYGVLDEEFKNSMNAENKSRIPESEFDYVVMIAGPDNYGDHPLDEYVEAIYRQNKLGYGVNEDGILLGIDASTESLVIRLFGRGAEIFSRDDVDGLIEAVRTAYQWGGYEGAVQAFLDGAYQQVIRAGLPRAESQKSYTCDFKTAVVSLKGRERGTNPIINGVVMPAWYVADPNSFVDFHNDPSEPRVIDLADLFTPEEETQIAGWLRELREESQQDVVVYTDTTSYGLDNELYEMDFYVYNGYGVGPDFDGLMIFVNMDPDHREVVMTAFGKTREVFTEYTSNQLRDIMLSYMSEKEYFKAFDYGLYGVGNLLKYGAVYAADWWVDYLEGADMARYSREKLVNMVGGISPEDEAEIIEKIQSLSEQYDTDIVVYLNDYADDLSAQGTGSDEERINAHLDTFWQVRGYGAGEDKHGILLGIFTEERASVKIQVRAYGEGAVGPKAKSLDSEAEKKLESLTLLNLGSGDYQYNVNRYLKFLGAYMKIGRVPYSRFVKAFWAALCAVGGLMTGFFTTARAKAKNNVVQEATRADEYLLAGSLRLISESDNFIATRVERRYSPESSDSDDDSRSGSSGSSSYSSSSSSSSGREGSTSRWGF